MTEASPCHIRDPLLMTEALQFFQNHGLENYHLNWLLWHRDIVTIEQLSTLSPEDVTELAKHMKLKLEARQYFRFLIWWVKSEVQKAKEERKTFQWTPAIDAQENDARSKFEIERLQKFDQIIESKTPMMIQNPYLVHVAL